MHMMTCQLVCEISYDGAGYSGFARQKEPRLFTIQGELEHALELILRRPVDMVCAGRTDAGVHARAQFASCECDVEELVGRNPRAFLKSLNALLPEDIVPQNIYLAPQSFSPRFDALSRTYTYRIFTGVRRPFVTRDYVWWYRGELDQEALQKASQFFVGEQDFISLCKTISAQGKSTVREIYECFWDTENIYGEQLLTFTVTGSAFLHSMVRTMVGSLVEVGSHRREPEWIKEMLVARSRSAAGPCAPAAGLTLESVAYPEGILRRCDTTFDVLFDATADDQQ